MMQKLLRCAGLSDNLLRIRKSKGMRQVEVITKLQVLGSNLSAASYSKIEHGVRNLKVSDLVRLRDIFDVDYAEFFTGIEIYPLSWIELPEE